MGMGREPRAFVRRACASAGAGEGGAARKKL